MNCKHCGSALTDHETFAPKSGGALHCDGCGCCFLLDGVTPRPGVPVCALVGAAPEASEPEAEEPSSDPPARTRRSRS